MDYFRIKGKISINKYSTSFYFCNATVNYSHDFVTNIISDGIKGEKRVYRNNYKGTRTWNLDGMKKILGSKSREKQ